MTICYFENSKFYEIFISNFESCQLVSHDNDIFVDLISSNDKDDVLYSVVLFTINNNNSQDYALITIRIEAKSEKQDNI